MDVVMAYVVKNLKMLCQKDMNRENEADAYAILEIDDLLIGHSIRLSDDRNQIHFRVETTHELDVYWSQTTKSSVWTTFNQLKMLTYE